MPEPAAEHAQQPLRRRVGSKTVITARHRSSNSHSRLNKLAPSATAAGRNGDVERSQSTEALTSLQNRRSSDSHDHRPKLGVYRGSRSSSRISVGPTKGAHHSHLPRRTAGKAVISIGPEDDEDEDDDEEEDVEEVDEEEEELKQAPRLQQHQSAATADKKTGEPSPDSAQDAISASASKPEAPQIESKEYNSSDDSTDNDHSSIHVRKVRPSMSLESLKPNTSFVNSPVRPQISNETVLAVVPSSALGELSISGANTPTSSSFDEASSFGYSTNVVKSHFLDNARLVEGRQSHQRSHSHTRLARASAPVLSRTQSSGGDYEIMTRKAHAVPSPSLTRTQQKLWLQRESIADQHNFDHTGDSHSIDSVDKREEERISKEYHNVTRYASPLLDSIKRIQKRIASSAAKLPTNSSSSNRNLDEVRKLATSDVNSWLLDEKKYPAGTAVAFENLAEVLDKLWHVPYFDAEARKELEKQNQANTAGDLRNNGGSPSILAQAQQAQQQLMNAHRQQQLLVARQQQMQQEQQQQHHHQQQQLAQQQQSQQQQNPPQLVQQHQLAQQQQHLKQIHQQQQQQQLQLQQQHQQLQQLQLQQQKQQQQQQLQAQELRRRQQQQQQQQLRQQQQSHQLQQSQQQGLNPPTQQALRRTNGTVSQGTIRLG
jgi:hypothetical protein